MTLGCIILEDNYPTTNIEALACGTPVITFDVGGSKESASSGLNIIIKNKDAVFLMDAIEKIKNYCYDFKVLKDISKNKMIQDYIELYNISI